MSKEEIQELYRVALTWTDGDHNHAQLLVRAYLRGEIDRDIIKQRKEI